MLANAHFAVRVIAGLAAVQAASAQPGLMNQNGTLFDASARFGVGYVNTYRPAPPILAGNALATGNVRGGLSLRSVSPIDSPTAFRGALGSAALSNFARDSVSAADAMNYGHPLAQPFYDPALTAPSVGYLTGTYPIYGLRSPETPRPGWVGPLPGSMAPGASGPGPILSGIVGAPLAQNAALSSSIFGFGGGADEPGLAAQLGSPGRLDVANLSGIAPMSGAPLTPGAPLASGAPLADTPEPGRALEQLLAGENDRLLRDGQPAAMGWAAPTPWTPGATGAPLVRPGPIFSPTPAMAEPATTASGAPRTGDALQFGQDVFRDLRLALAVQSQPDAEWLNDLGSPSSDDPRQAAERIRTSPIRSFAAGGGGGVNDPLASAEALLGIGRYYDAAGKYDAARLVDPANPLPLIGKAHALLAAGEYQSAALFLVRGLERFPDIARFEIDLKSLLGDPEVVDIRRSDLIKRLSNSEEPRLRFLLGYIEYHAGYRESGMENLEKAARESAPGSLIWRYPGMLRGETLPVPKMDFGDPTLDEATPASPARPQGPGLGEPAAPRSPWNQEKPE